MAMAQGRAMAQAAPPEITTDTPEYCIQLQERFDNLRLTAPMPPPTEVLDLSVEGQRMCDHGQTRGGIMRLRSALRIMMQREDAH
jgi:hypothetical protein